MEEKAKQEKSQPQKLSYEELNKAASDLSIQYQKAIEHIRRLESALAEADFNRTSFLLSSMFQVMNHAELYDEKFIDWCKDNIQSAISTFYEQSIPAEPEQKKDEA